MKSLLLFSLLLLYTCESTEQPAADCSSSSKISENSSKTADEAYLQKLSTEISSLATEMPCSEDWKFTAIGSKPCGGPAGYIAYSPKIDTTCFLQKVAAFTEESRKFNEKYQRISDCSLQAPPKSVKCEGGKAVLVY